MRKIAFITGATSGFGTACARKFHGAGWNVVLTGRREDRLSALAEELGSRRVHTACFDVRDREAVFSAVEQLPDDFREVDVLVNNAGVQFVSPIEDFPAEKWDQIIAINLTSSFHTIHHAVPAMKKSGQGRIINVVSAHGLVASPFKSAYVAAKHGMMGLTKTVALEVAEHGITVNAICPGYVLTPLVEKQIPDTAKARGITEEEVKRDVLLAAQPTKEFVTTEEIASAALYLASDSARQVTGTHISMDGGWTAQ